jgi:hypothetical protein
VAERVVEKVRVAEKSNFFSSEERELHTGDASMVWGWKG